MPALNLMESNEKVIEINHHLVPLNTHHYNDWINPRDLLNTLLHLHPGSSAGGGSTSSGSPQHSQSGPHHGHNETSDFQRVRNTTPVLPGHPGHGPGAPDDVEEESVIVVYALFLPLLAALIFILIVALYVRRMRRTNSMNSVSTQKENEIYLEEIKVHKRDSNASSRKSKSSSKESTKLSRSVSSVNISHNNNKLSKKELKNGHYYNPEPYRISKRENSTGFLNSSFSLHEEVREDELQEVSVVDINPSASAPTFPITFSSTHSLAGEENSHPSLRPTYSSSAESTVSSTSTSSNSSRKGIKVIGGKLIKAINIPRKIKQHNMEKNRFNIYTIPTETREQLKQIYVY